MVPYDDAVTRRRPRPATSSQVAPGRARSPTATARARRRCCSSRAPTPRRRSRTAPTKPLGDQLNVRATEFTIGDSGPAAMPGELPPTSAYTYAVEYSVDEADEAGATDVALRQAGRHLRRQLPRLPGRHAPSRPATTTASRRSGSRAQNGIVIKIVAESGGRAASTPTATAAADTTRSASTTPSWRKLAELYAAGKASGASRSPTSRRGTTTGPTARPTAPAAPARAARTPATRRRRRPVQRGRLDHPLRGPDRSASSLPIAGTPYDARLPAPTACPAAARATRSRSRCTRRDAAGRRWRASTSTIEVAGRTFKQSVHAAERRTCAYTFIWDGKDAYGRARPGPPEGRRQARLRLPGGLPARRPTFGSSSFAAVGGAPLRRPTARATRSRSAQQWSGDASAALDARRRARSAAGRSTSTTPTTRSAARSTWATAAPPAPRPTASVDVARPRRPASTAPEGIAARARRLGAASPTPRDQRRSRRIAPDGTITVVAGIGAHGYRRRRRRRPGDRGASSTIPRDVARRPRRRDLRRRHAATTASAGSRRDGTITTVAGTGDARLRRRRRRRARRDARRADRRRGRRRTARSTSSTAPTHASAGSAPTARSRRSPAPARRASAATAARPPARAAQPARRRGATPTAASSSPTPATTACAGSAPTARSRPSPATAADGYGGDGGPATARSLDDAARPSRSMRDGGAADRRRRQRAAARGRRRRHDRARRRQRRRAARAATAARPARRGSTFPQAIAVGADDSARASPTRPTDRVRSVAAPLPGFGDGEFTDRVRRRPRALRVRPHRPPPAHGRRADRRPSLRRFGYDARGPPDRDHDDGDGQHDDDRARRRAAERDRDRRAVGGRTTTLARRRRGYLSSVTNPAGDGDQLDVRRRRAC